VTRRPPPTWPVRVRVARDPGRGIRSPRLTAADGGHRTRQELTDQTLRATGTSRRYALVSVVAMAALVMTACSSGASDPAATVTPSPPASAPPTASPSPLPSGFRLGHFPEAPTDPFPDPVASALQEVLDAAVEEGLPGVSATVVVADGGTWSGAAGTADGVDPVDVDSKFAIASITKTVVAAEVMRLVDEGLLRLSDPISDHLPADFEFETSGVTVENLLAMESGIPDPQVPGVEADPLRAWTPREVLATVPAHRNTPGERFVYEDANYMLLALVIEETTGRTVASALRSGITSDPALSSLVYQPEERPEPPVALPFRAGAVRSEIVEAGGGYLPSKASASAAGGSGAMASDAEALARWGYLLFGGALLSEESLLAMTDFGSGNDYDGYGLGVFDQTHIGAGYGATAIGNGGWDVGGYSSVLTVLPGEGTVIVVLSNEAGDPRVLVFPVAQGLAAALER
jgi:D-alanyl-D-alanine carboxypeptidase